MSNSIAVNSSQNHTIDYSNIPKPADSSPLFADMLQTTMQLEDPEVAEAKEETTSTNNKQSNNAKSNINTNNITTTNGVNSYNASNTGIQNYTGEENASATAVSSQDKLDTNTLLLCMMMGGGFGGIASALAMGAMLSDDGSLDTLRGLFQSSSLFQNNTTGTINSAGASVARAVAGALSTPFEAWKKATPAVVSNEDNRSASLYRQVIEQFDVENNGRYSVNKMGYGDTYCNIFMWDVTSAMGAEIPHYINKNTNQPTTSADPDALEMTANSTYDWLHEYGSQYGWQKVDEQTAQAYANQGMPAVSIYKASGHGHAQIISPSNNGGYDATKGAAIAQAGRKLYDYAYTSNVYSQNTRNSKVAYFVHV